LEEFEEAGCISVFWKAYSSEIERSVMGVVSDGLEEANLRMLVDTIWVNDQTIMVGLMA
jgi:hypothetical protein